jgi:transcription antitermination factor NusG
MLLENSKTDAMAVDAGLVSFPWFAVWVKGRCEQEAASHLRARGYNPYLPTYFERRQWSDRVRMAELPLFPGYLFCRFDPQDRLPILTAPGVIQILGVGKTPLPVADAEVEAIQAIAQSGLPKRPWPYLQVGQRVRIGSGALRGVEGILIEIRGEHRLVVSVELLRRSVAVEIDPESAGLLSIGRPPVPWRAPTPQAG